MKFSFLLSLVVLFTLSSCFTNSRQKALQAEKSNVVAFINSGELPAALTRLRALLQEYPKDAELNNLMGLVQLSLRNFLPAISYFDKSYSVDPKPSVALNKSSTLIEIGNYSEARKILATLIKDKSKNSYVYKERLYHNLAYSYQKEGKYKLAIKVYNRALKENPIYHMSWLNKGVCYSQLSDSRRALLSFNKAKMNCRGCYEPVTYLVDTYLKLNQAKKAQKELREFLAVENIDSRMMKMARARLNTLSGGKSK